MNLSCNLKRKSERYLWRKSSILACERDFFNLYAPHFHQNISNLAAPRKFLHVIDLSP